jgi:hypothetical protein
MHFGHIVDYINGSGVNLYSRMMTKIFDHEGAVIIKQTKKDVE